MHALDDHVGYHLPHRHGQLDALGDDVKAASEAEKVERARELRRVWSVNVVNM
jgi:hypothetical protein